MRGTRALIALILTAPLLCAAPAHAFIYWGGGQSDTIGRAANDGSDIEDSFIHTGSDPTAVAVDASHIYWANESSESIGRANINGTEVNNSFITGISQPSGVAVNSTYIFWSSLGSSKVGRANIDGSNQMPSLIPAQAPCGVALDSGHVYWASAGTPALVGRASFDGSNLEPSFVTMSNVTPCGVAVNSANVFWADLGFFAFATNIGRADINTGMGVDESTIDSASGPCGLALDSSSHLYWANAGTDTIGRANTDSTMVNESFITTKGTEICGVAVDDLEA